MDPTANLQEQRRLVKRIQDLSNSSDLDALLVVSADAARLAELAGALDEWLKAGGFLPPDWMKVRQLAADPVVQSLISAGSGLLNELMMSERYEFPQAQRHIKAWTELVLPSHHEGR
jgi:hypothetical protein